MYPLSNSVCVIAEDENSAEALMRKMVSIKNTVAIELHNELNSKITEAKPYLRANILPDCEPKRGLSIKRWLAL